MKPIKVLSVFGTRPEAIKMVPIIKELEKRPTQFQSIIAVTSQHREMLDQVMNTFSITPDYDLDVMSKNQSLSQITVRVLEGLEEVILKVRPDIVLVHGDTTSSFVAAITAFYHQIPVGHVEAGLRTYNKYGPFPEEMNRQLTDVITSLYFAPTEKSKKNLLNEGKPEESIFVTGDTAIDTLSYTTKNKSSLLTLKNINYEQRIILLTMHRRESQGKSMKDVFQAMFEILEAHEDVDLVMPVHLNPTIQQTVKEHLGNHPRVKLLPPLAVDVFHQLIAKSYLVATDSGGLQEEAPSLGVPVLVLRNQTERPEGVASGTLKVIGTKKEDVVKEVEKLLNNPTDYNKMVQASNPYGDGNASERIIDALAYFFDINKFRPDSF